MSDQQNTDVLQALLDNANKVSGSPAWAKAKAVSALVRYAVVAAVFLFTAGMTFTYYSEALVRKEAFSPVKYVTENDVPRLEKEVSEIQARTKATSLDVTDTHVQLGAITLTLQDISERQKELYQDSTMMTLCSMHRDTYVANLADYVTKNRKYPPRMSDGYTRCIESLSIRAHGGGTGR